MALAIRERGKEGLLRLARGVLAEVLRSAGGSRFGKTVENLSVFSDDLTDNSEHIAVGDSGPSERVGSELLDGHAPCRRSCVQPDQHVRRHLDLQDHLASVEIRLSREQGGLSGLPPVGTAALSTQPDRRRSHVGVAGEVEEEVEVLRVHFVDCGLDLRVLVTFLDVEQDGAVCGEDTTNAQGP